MRPLHSLAIFLLAVTLSASAAEDDCNGRVLFESKTVDGGTVTSTFTVAVNNCDACFGDFDYTLIFINEDGEEVARNLGSSWGAQDSTKLFTTYDIETIGPHKSTKSIEGGPVTRCVCTKPASTESDS